MKEFISTCRQKKISLQIQFRKLVQKVATWLEVQEERSEEQVKFLLKEENKKLQILLKT